MPHETNNNETTVDELAEAVEHLSEGKKLAVKDWLVIVLAMVGILGFVGQYFVNTYRLGQIEKNHEELRDMVVKQQEMINKIPGVIDVLTVRGSLLSEHTKTLADLMMFRAQQDTLSVDVRAHLKDQTIHVTATQQQAMIQQTLQPMMTQMTKLEVQADERQKQMDRMEGLIKDLGNKTPK